MPELPEVETIRRQLDTQSRGRRIVTVRARGRRSFRRHASGEELVARVEGRMVTGVGRRGKHLLVGLDGGQVLVVHLGMSGQLRWVAGEVDPPLPAHTHAVVAFAGEDHLLFVDPRTFGQLYVTGPGSREGEVPELAHLGPEPLDGLTSDRLGSMLHLHRARLKPLLLDQRFVAGLGNIYCDEVLFRAGLRHDRPSGSLSTREVGRLHQAMVQTLQEAVENRGSSLADRQYRDLFGEMGEFQRLHRVYDREGQACLRCGGSIVRARSAGRSTFHCDRCQR